MCTGKTNKPSSRNWSAAHFTHTRTHTTIHIFIHTQRYTRKFTHSLKNAGQTRPLSTARCDGALATRPNLHGTRRGLVCAHVCVCVSVCVCLCLTRAQHTETQTHTYTRTHTYTQQHRGVSHWAGGHSQRNDLQVSACVCTCLCVCAQFHLFSIFVLFVCMFFMM